MIRKFTARCPETLALVALTLTLPLGCSSKDDGPSDIEPTAADCQRDDHNEPAVAADITVGEAAEGYVCPKDDRDWYKLTIPASDQLVSIDLGMAIPRSPVDITYAIYQIDGNGEPGLAVAQPPSDEVDVGVQLGITHCITPGDYLMVVRDQGDDTFDNRNSYTLAVSTAADPDTAEPNQDAAGATAISAGVTSTGYIACRGDEDWYSVTVPDGNRLVVKFTSPISNYEPRVRIHDAAGAVLTVAENKASATTATDIDLAQVLPGAGTYYVSVSDDNDADADPAVPYSLTVEGIVDIDPNEPNDNPRQATEVSGSPVACGADWSQTFTFSGTIGSQGDDDWFRIPLSGCTPGVIDASVTFDTNGLSAQDQWELAAAVQANLTIVRPHGPSGCNDDEDCNTLQLSCGGPLDCAGYFETCLGQGLCAGSVACLAEGVCGANQMQRRWECPSRLPECTPGANPPPPNAAEVGAPILNDDYLYLRVNDFQANGFAADKTYTLRVRVRAETDNNEPSNLPLNLISPSYSRRDLSGGAVAIPIHDCTAGDCCSGGDVSGTLSYDSDVDWYRFPHPCPGSDCTLRMVWSTEGGPTDIAINVYRSGGGSWNVARDPDERVMQSADSGSLGGAAANDECFYAYQSHEESGYLVEVRDRFSLFSDDVTVDPQSRDWDASQSYSFCVEKVSNVCEEPPCQIYPNGCGQPQ